MRQLQQNVLRIGLSLIFLWGCSESTEFNQETVSDEGETILIGQVDLIGLSEKPYEKWFNENYENYTVDTNALDGISLEDVDIRIFLGTWCEDSQLQVPEFYKILNYLDYDLTKVEMISLYHRPELYLQSPQHEEEGMNIINVPTFIFFRNGQEIGRIVEFPETSLEKDMTEIVRSL